MGKILRLHAHRHQSRVGGDARTRPFNVIRILYAPLKLVYVETDGRIDISTRLLINLEILKIENLDQLLQVMKTDQSILHARCGQRSMNEILNIFGKLRISL